MQRADLSARAAGFGHILSRMFPTPQFLSPRSMGVDISDASIKWVALKRSSSDRRVEAWGQETLETGIVESGVVRDVARLSEALRSIRKKVPRIGAIHAALPEESAFIFSMSAPPGSTRQQIRDLIEFEFETRVPIAPAAAVYDFDLIPAGEGEAQEIGVVAFPRDIAENYAQAFENAGFLPLSFELEARSIARAAVPSNDTESIVLLVDFGLRRTGFAVLKRGVPIFTSTVEIGGEALDRALSDSMHLSPKQIEVWKNEQGLLPSEGPKSPGLEALSGAASSLGSEVARHFNYWDTRRNERGERVTPVSRVLLVGGSSNMKGIGDYISGRVQAPVERPNLWCNVCSFDEYIPPIDRRTSLQYATAIGLALRD
jgi:type IV pilus assembly protein PilM